MSRETLKEFFEELKKNEVLEKKFEAVVDSCGEIFAGKVLELAKSAGFNCTAGDLKELMKENSELSDEDMQKAAGGYWRVYPPYWYYKEKYGKKNKAD